MKITILIEDGTTQLVLMPENEFEKAIAKSIMVGEATTIFKHGSFRDCQGGWIREYKDEESLIIKVTLKDRESVSIIKTV